MVAPYSKKELYYAIASCIWGRNHDLSGVTLEWCLAHVHTNLIECLKSACYVIVADPAMRKRYAIIIEAACKDYYLNSKYLNMIDDLALLIKPATKSLFDFIDFTPTKTPAVSLPKTKRLNTLKLRRLPKTKTGGA